LAYFKRNPLIDGKNKENREREEGGEEREHSHV